MPTLQEEFEAYKRQQAASRDFGLQQQFEAYKRELAQGGAIKTAPPEPSVPVGAVVGGVAGTVTGGPAGGMAGAVVGEAAQQAVEVGLGLPSAPQTGLQSAQRLIQEGIYGFGAEVLRAPGFLVERAAPFAGRMTAEGKDAAKFLSGKGAPEPQFLPAEVTDSRVLDVLQNVSEYSLLGGGAIKTFRRNRDEFFTQLADQMIDQYGSRASADEAGRAVVDAAKRNLEVAQIPAKMIYRAISAATAPDYVDVPQRMIVKRTDTPIKKSVVDKASVKIAKESSPATDRFVGYDDAGDAVYERVPAGAPELRGIQTKTTYQDVQIGERLEHLKIMTSTQERQVSGAKIDLGSVQEDLAGMSEILKRASGLANREMGTTLLEFINNKPDIVSYPVAQAIRTEVRTLRDVLKNSPEAKNAPAIGKANLIYGKLTEQIRKGLAEDDPFLAQMWDEANKIEAQGHATFNNRIIRSMVKKADEQGQGKPEAIADAVWRRNNVSVIQKVRAAVDPDDWRKMQSVQMQQVFANALTKDGRLDGVRLEQQLFGPKGLGEQAVEAGFDKPFIAEMKGLINALKVAQQEQAEGTGRMLIQLRQGGVAIALAGGAMFSDDYSGELLGSAGLVLLGPAVLGRLMTSPGGAQWLTEGLKTPLTNTKRALAIAGHLSAILAPRPLMETQTAEQIPGRASIAPMPGVAPLQQ